ncbi:MAG TPA: serine dehydratase beta chain, partial [Silvibacterium sp.]|nr:serine dehydratase beta chain [Silvibacterium sp.]
MGDSLTVINASANGCGACSTTGCGTCAPSPNKNPASAGLSRREFGYAVLIASAGTILAGCSEEKATAQASTPAPALNDGDVNAVSLSPNLEIVKESREPIMTTLEEFYKMGPGPSSSHTMGPMRITYDFFQRVTKLPDDQLKQATALKVHLYGSLSATGKGHGTDRASLAGLLGKAPATCPPQFLDGLAA